jgi:16S rRNA (cytidine1402-2'-O)-methyltransferase
MTKLHEVFIRGTLSDILVALADRPEVKGECTLLVDGAAAAVPVADADLADALRHALAQPGVRLSGLSKSFAKQYNLPRKTVYEMALTILKETDASARRP